jgi:hypothetical protein
MSESPRKSTPPSVEAPDQAIGYGEEPNTVGPHSVGVPNQQVEAVADQSIGLKENQDAAFAKVAKDAIAARERRGDTSALDELKVEEIEEMLNGFKEQPETASEDRAS